MAVTRVKIPQLDANGNPRFVAFDYDDVTDTYTEVVVIEGGGGGGGTAASTTADNSGWSILTGDDVQEVLDEIDGGFVSVLGQIADLGTDIASEAAARAGDVTALSAADVGLDARLDVLEAKRTVVRKPSDTSKTSDTTVASDPHLTVAVGTGTFLTKVVAIFDSATNADINIGLATPGSSTVRGAIFGPAISATAVGHTIAYLGPASGNAAAGGIGVGTSSVIEIRATVVTTGSGSIAVQWAQNSNQATATTVSAGSSIEVEQIA